VKAKFCLAGSLKQMKKFRFFKTSGSGNDFIVADNREGQAPDMEFSRLAALLCRRKYSVGADGLILLENSTEADFAWRFFNSDGSEAQMCGNGSRCAARVAHLLGIAGPEMSFMTLAGKIKAEVMGDRVKVKMTDPADLRLFYPLTVDGKEFNVSSVNTGVPHVVLLVDDIKKAEVLLHGRKIRHHQEYAPAGTNVNFVQLRRGGDIFIRTYERGVEDETLACGTGAVAAAIVRSATDASASPIHVHVKGGEVLTIHFSRKGLKYFDVFLEGDAKIIYEAELGADALR